ncbi:MAG: KpsF/GutQ family sugar-phosphate isomerase [Nitrospirae bacterium]|nr:KpsF/GutQ family sugar-phosphate isomerase [Nitrospirota bacterium]
MDNILEIAKRVLKIEADAVSALTEKLDSSFEKAIELIYKSRGRVIVTGMGKSGLVGKKIAATLASTGTPAFFLHPAEASHGDLGMVTSDDVIIAISNSGETEELVGLIPFLKRFNVNFISMTGNTASTLSKAADITLDISVKEEACPMGLVPTASTTAALTMGDAMAVEKKKKKGLREEDFAFFLITDGDLRRGIEKWGKAFFDMKAGDVMSKNPKSIAEDELAAKALSVMEHHSITALLVPDQEGRAKGIIHLHDILRKGIV